MEKINYTPADLEDHEAIAAVIKDKQGRVLIFKHKKFDFWTIPIGKAEPGQTPYQGLRQELLEECDIQVEKATEIATKPYEYIRNGKKVHLTLHIFLIEKYTGDIKNNEPQKHTKMIFMSLAEIRSKDKLSDATNLFLENSGL